MKYDGVRALAYLERGNCHLVSRNGHGFSSFGPLTSSLARIPHEGGAILDGEIVCVDRKGRPRFEDLLFRRVEPRFFAFDLLYLDGKDCRRDPLVSVTEAIDTSTPAGKMVFTVLGAVAELERSIIRERVVAGQSAARRRGVRFGRPIVSVNTAQVLRLRNDGLSWRAISAETGIAKDTLRRSVQA